MGLRALPVFLLSLFSSPLFSYSSFSFSPFSHLLLSSLMSLENIYLPSFGSVVELKSLPFALWLA